MHQSNNAPNQQCTKFSAGATLYDTDN